ncbi:hypothetical protein AM493_17435 [Flavobacterium akiainvivens]|uniref:Redox-active disulfide protein 2 n=1 Tax=Flavobacterium akiainvivens TaxID=1202724 RepID=A0A0M8MF62_9FLAO|nr:hypothetical protein [Flavobacterium akiainvivens]KOS07624.1 hypothetical protein AM493_17435 [Flavobacterium akiainvivens]
MKTNKFAEMPDAKLLNLEKTVKAVLYMFAAAIVIMLITTIYTSVTRGFSAVSVLPVAFLPILLLNVNNLNEIKKEIKARGLR